MLATSVAATHFVYQLCRLWLPTPPNVVLLPRQRTGRFFQNVRRPYLISYTCPVRPVGFFLRSPGALFRMWHQLNRGRRWLRHLSHEVPGHTATRAPGRPPECAPAVCPWGTMGQVASCSRRADRKSSTIRRISQPEKIQPRRTGPGRYRAEFPSRTGAKVLY